MERESQKKTVEKEKKIKKEEDEIWEENDEKVIKKSQKTVMALFIIERERGKKAGDLKAKTREQAVTRKGDGRII